jgi:folate-binding protein YgfZ
MPQPLHDTLQQRGAELIGYGPAPETAGGPGPGPCRIAEDFGSYEAEYAAVRRHVGVLHLPQTGLVRVAGDDRADFLHRMCSQDVNAMRGGDSRRAFQLTADGHILGDMHVHHGDADTWLELDRFDIPPVLELLGARLFAEDVAFTDITDTRETLALLGPASVQLLGRVATHTAEGMTPASVGEMPGTHHVLRLGEALVTACRRDVGQVLGLRLFVPTEHALAVYDALLDAAGYAPDADPAEQGEAFARQRRASLRGRPIGWAAYNTARIEEGLPVYHIDFGPDSQPAELGDETFRGAVSLTKGCYLGQEAVARMYNLSHPKRVLVGLKLHADHLPVAGTQVFEHDPDKRARAPRGGQVGGVTSSTVSPMLGATAVAFAVMKWGRHRPGTKVAVASGGSMVDAEVCGLRFLAAGD